MAPCWLSALRNPRPQPHSCRRDAADDVHGEPRLAGGVLDDLKRMPRVVTSPLGPARPVAEVGHRRKHVVLVNESRVGEPRPVAWIQLHTLGRRDEPAERVRGPRPRPKLLGQPKEALGAQGGGLHRARFDGRGEGIEPLSVARAETHGRHRPVVVTAQMHEAGQVPRDSLIPAQARRRGPRRSCGGHEGSR